jgi:hypothetical protein
MIESTLNDVIDHLAGACPSLVAVEGPVAMSAVARGDLPVALLYPAADVPYAVPTGPAIVTMRIAIQIVCEGLNSLGTVRGEIYAALHRYQPADALSPLFFAGGQLNTIEGARLQWTDTWELRASIT